MKESKDADKSIIDPLCALKDEAKRKTIEEKQAEIKAYRVSEAYDELEQQLDEKKKNEEFSLDFEVSLEDLASRTKELIDASRQPSVFLNQEISDAVKMHAPNLIVIGAKTGSAKTTCAANIAFKHFKEGRKCLYISNEEEIVDVVNRVACIDLGLSYNHKKNFTPDDYRNLIIKQEEVVKFLKVIGTDFAGGRTLTKSVDGIEGILEQVRGSGAYECVIIDYMQNVSAVNNQGAGEVDKWKVIKKLSEMLDHQFKIIGAPICLFVQLKPEFKGGTFEDRIKEGKSIFQVATTGIELVPNFEDRTTAVKIVKARFGDPGREFKVKYSWGKMFESADLDDGNVLEMPSLAKEE